MVCRLFRRCCVRGNSVRMNFSIGSFTRRVRSKPFAWAIGKRFRAKLGAPLELYDLAKDLGETKNIADRHPDVVARFETYLKTARTDSPYWSMKATGKSRRSDSIIHTAG